MRNNIELICGGGLQRGGLLPRPLGGGDFRGGHLEPPRSAHGADVPPPRRVLPGAPSGLQFFGGLVLGCIKTKFCEKIIMCLTAFFKL